MTNPNYQLIKGNKFKYIINPYTKRKILLRGKIGKQILKNYYDIYKKNNIHIGGKKYKYIINPRTGRKVLLSGKLGQQILKQLGGESYWNRFKNYSKKKTGQAYKFAKDHKKEIAGLALGAAGIYAGKKYLDNRKNKSSSSSPNSSSSTTPVTGTSTSQKPKFKFESGKQHSPSEIYTTILDITCMDGNNNINSNQDFYSEKEKTWLIKRNHININTEIDYLNIINIGNREWKPTNKMNDYFVKKQEKLDEYRLDMSDHSQEKRRRIEEGLKLLNRINDIKKEDDNLQNYYKNGDDVRLHNLVTQEEEYERLAPNLVIEIKREKWDGEIGVDNRAFNIEENFKFNETQYHLNSIICYSGGGNAGHYTSYIRCCGINRESYLNGQWYYCNDDVISRPLTLKEVKEGSNKRFPADSSSVLMFYCLKKDINTEIPIGIINSSGVQCCFNSLIQCLYHNKIYKSTLKQLFKNDNSIYIQRINNIFERMMKEKSKKKLVINLSNELQTLYEIPFEIDPLICNKKSLTDGSIESKSSTDGSIESKSSTDGSIESKSSIDSTLAVKGNSLDRGLSGSTESDDDSDGSTESDDDSDGSTESDDDSDGSTESDDDSDGSTESDSPSESPSESSPELSLPPLPPMESKSSKDSNSENKEKKEGTFEKMRNFFNFGKKRKEKIKRKTIRRQNASTEYDVSSDVINELNRLTDTSVTEGMKELKLDSPQNDKLFKAMTL
jgi:hypothetical protein